MKKFAGVFFSLLLVFLCADWALAQGSDKGLTPGNYSTKEAAPTNLTFKADFTGEMTKVIMGGIVDVYFTWENQAPDKVIITYTGKREETPFDGPSEVFTDNNLKGQKLIGKVSKNSKSIIFGKGGIEDTYYFDK
jgi:hypothetical protein